MPYIPYIYHGKALLIMCNARARQTNMNLKDDGARRQDRGQDHGTKRQERCQDHGTKRQDLAWRKETRSCGWELAR